MAEFNQNVWAPWRMEYIRSLTEELDDGCFLCKYWENPNNDSESRVIWRSGSAFVIMNRFPYTNGHLLIAPARHQADLTDLHDDELAELSHMVRDGVTILREAMHPQGFNIGYNIGQCAGAGLPGHVHAHLVPRWSGDTNFMTVVGDIRVVPDSLDALYVDLVQRAEKAGLRGTSGTP